MKQALPVKLKMSFTLPALDLDSRCDYQHAITSYIAFIIDKSENNDSIFERLGIELEELEDEA